MKKILKHLLFSTLLLGLFGAALAVKPTVSQSVEADSVNPYPSSGRSGTLMFVNGNGNFKKGEANLKCPIWGSLQCLVFFITYLLKYIQS